MSVVIQRQAGDLAASRSAERRDDNCASGGRLVEIQRARMLMAGAEVACVQGAGRVTVAQVVAQAGVSRRTFYEIFSDCEDCLLAAFEDGVARMEDYATRAYRSPGSWGERIRASLTALLQFVDEEPSLGRLVIVESLGAGPRLLERRARLVARLAAVVDAGRTGGRASVAVTPFVAEGVVGAVLSLVYGRMVEADGKPILDLLNPLMSMIVLPYLGASASRRELDRPVVRRSPRRTPVRCNPLKDLEIRLTYRTVRALTAVALDPGASNRAVADAAGIADQGQVSRLLARLERIGLIENAGIGAAVRGEPNAWTLTERGEQVHAAIGAESTVG